jgi:hypothetical protein
MPRDGRRALAALGNLRNTHETDFAVVDGRKSFAIKRILGGFSGILIIRFNSMQEYLA